MFNKNCEVCGKYLVFPIDDFEKNKKVCKYYKFSSVDMNMIVCPHCKCHNFAQTELKIRNKYWRESIEIP
jgi:hypothetical protein